MGNIFEVLSHKELGDKCKLMPFRLIVELNNNEKENWVVHLHYRNLRIELTAEEFVEFAGVVTEASRRLSTLSA